MASIPEPVPGLVLRYSYLWQSEHARGVEEGQKDRPCAIVLVVDEVSGGQRVTVLPVTHVKPTRPDQAIEIPLDVKRRLELDDDRSWVVVTEANRFRWPGPDIRRASPQNSASFVFGPLPRGLFIQIRDGFLEKVKQRTATAVMRTE